MAPGDTTVGSRPKEGVDQLKQSLDLTNGQIRAAFEILGERNVPTEQLASKLMEMARQFQAQRSIAQFEPGDTAAILELKKQAQAAIR